MGDFVLEVGQEMGLTPLQALQPQADRLTEELEDWTRPTAVRLAGLVTARVAATLVGSAPVIAAMDGMATLGAAGQLSRLAYLGLHDRFVPAATPRSQEPESSSTSGIAPNQGTGVCEGHVSTYKASSEACSCRCCSTSTQWRARRYHLASEKTREADDERALACAAAALEADFAAERERYRKSDEQTRVRLSELQVLRH